jgi:hypothetical protein
MSLGGNSGLLATILYRAVNCGTADAFEPKAAANQANNITSDFSN